jgi:ectoine hydroxylase-related dioxygenase (phytanoyl-CoA dioxygenase family)
VATQADRDLYCLRQSGFLVVPDFVPAGTVRSISRKAWAFEDEVARFVAAGGEAILRHSWPLRTTRCMYAIVPEVQDLLLDTRVQMFVRGYLGAAVARDCLVQTIMPDPRNATRGVNADVSFHRDTLWPDGLIRPMYLHAFVLLDECTRQNGATIVVPGSHREREPGYYFKLTDPHDPQDGIEYRVYERRYFPSALCLEAPAGSLVLLDPMTIHTQGNNVTDERRSLLNMTFRAADVSGRPPLLNARAIAERFARVRVRAEVLELLEADPSLPAHFGPLGNSWPPGTAETTP